jgi:hypothetical protein
MEMEENNGGKTGYYDLPLPDREKIKEILIKFRNYPSMVETITDEIIDLCPQTLNDLIEHKQMQPWQHEVMKVTYALNERAMKNPKKGSSKLREVNKILYYANRGKNIFLNAENLVEKSKPHFKIKIQSPIIKQEEEND